MYFMCIENVVRKHEFTDHMYCATCHRHMTTTVRKFDPLNTRFLKAKMEIEVTFST